MKLREQTDRPRRVPPAAGRVRHICQGACIIRHVAAFVCAASRRGAHHVILGVHGWVGGQIIAQAMKLMNLHMCATWHGRKPGHQHCLMIEAGQENDHCALVGVPTKSLLLLTLHSDCPAISGMSKVANSFFPF